MLNVVIADDEQNIIELMQRMLKPDLATVVGVAMDGLSALECVKEKHPDVLITDIRMPGCSGIDLIVQVKRIYPDIDIVVISGYREFDYLQSILRFGVQEFLLKPVEETELNNTLLRLAQRRESIQNRENYIKSIEADLSQSQERLREEFVMKLLDNAVDFNSLGSDLADLFAFGEGKYRVAILKADHYTENDDGEKEFPYVQNLLRRFRDIIVNSFRSFCYEVCCAIRGNRVYFIFNYPGDMDDRAFWDRSGTNKLYLNDMLATENYKYGFLHFTLGLGIPVHSLSALGDSRRSAQDAIGNRLNAHSTNIIGGNAVSEPAHIRTALTSDMKNRLYKALGTLDAQVLLAEIGAAVQSLVEQNAYGQIYDYARASLEFIRENAMTQNLIDEAECPDFLPAIADIDNCFTIDLLRERLTRFMTDFVQRIVSVQEARASRPIREALEYIKQSYNQQITVQSVSEMISYSPNYFSTVLKQQTGKTFLEHLTALRISAAQELLRNSNMNIGEIAREVGYMNEKYFSRLFVKVVGIKPKEYRKFYS